MVDRRHVRLLSCSVLIRQPSWLYCDCLKDAMWSYRNTQVTATPSKHGISAYYHIIFDIKISSYFIMQTCQTIFQVNKLLPYLNQLSASFVFNTDYQPPNQKGPHTLYQHALLSIICKQCNPNWSGGGWTLGTLDTTAIWHGFPQNAQVRSNCQVHKSGLRYCVSPAHHHHS